MKRRIELTVLYFVIIWALILVFGIFVGLITWVFEKYGNDVGFGLVGALIMLFFAWVIAGDDESQGY